MSIPESEFPTLSHWDSRYDDAIRLAVAKTPIKAPCDNPVLLLKAMAKAESGWKRKTEFAEPAPLKGVISTGMLQISLNSSRSYKCGMTKKEDLYHPIKNLVCGVNILAHWQKKLPKGSIYETGGKYWSVLRDRKNWPGRKTYAGIDRVRAYAKANGCVFP